MSLKNNYRPISVLSSLSKVSERLLLKQFLPFIKKTLGDSARFQKGHSTQLALFRVVEMVRRCIDKGGVVTSMVLMDLSKAYYFLPHDLLIAKLDAFSVGSNSLK